MGIGTISRVSEDDNEYDEAEEVARRKKRQRTELKKDESSDILFMLKNQVLKHM